MSQISIQAESEKSYFKAKSKYEENQKTGKCPAEIPLHHFPRHFANYIFAFLNI